MREDNEKLKYDSLRAVLMKTAGAGDVAVQSVSGGDINRAYKLTVNGQLFFLYHLLNHLNLFGGSFLGSVRHVLRTYA